MVCEATGIELSMEELKDVRVNPLKPTLDRIDSKKGYTMDNTQLVCWWYNVMKQDWSNETVIFLLNEYIKNKKEKDI